MPIGQIDLYWFPVIITYMKLLSRANTKTMKGEKYGYLTFILHLAPSNLSGYNVCPKASAGCIAACLNTAGMGRFTTVQLARIRKTKWYMERRADFMSVLENDIKLAKKQAERLKLKLAIRLNGTSDLPILAIKMAEKFPEVQFYDYTKIIKTFERKLPDNYDLTFSRSESNEKDVDTAINEGFKVAVVFSGKTLPKTWQGIEVINGDESDLRFLDKKGVIVGLTTKGKARQDTSGFVVTV